MAHPTADNSEVAVFVSRARSGERGTEAALATSERQAPSVPGSDEASEFERNDNGSKPLDQAGLIKGPVCDLEHDGDDLRLRCLDLKTVDEQKHVHGHKTDSLVSVEERVVLDEAEAVASGEGVEVGFWIEAPAVSWPGKSRLKEAVVAHSEKSTMLLDLIVMGRFHHRAGKPGRFLHEYYLASSRRALRYLLAVRS